MAPRESTGLFHDQFLQFDYETAQIQNGPPMPQDGMGGATDIDSVDESGGADPNALSAVGTGTESADNHQSSAAASQVDPLSIDPTMGDESTTWSLAASIDGRLVAGSAVLGNAAEAEGGRTLVSVTSVESAYSNINNTRRPILSPLTTGSTGSYGTTAPNSPTSLHTSSFYSARSSQTIHSEEQQQQPLPPRLVASRSNNMDHANMLSMLDAAMSMEEGEGGSVPVLERTFDSATTASSSSGFVRWVTEGSNGMVDDNDDDDDDGDASQGSNPSQSSSASSVSTTSDTLRMIYRNPAFEDSTLVSAASPIPSSPSSSDELDVSPLPPPSPNSIQLSFHPNTTVADLKYFAERGCIVPLLQALDTPRLVTLGARMLADYAKMAQRRVAVASNRRILEFVQRTMLLPESEDWLGREYAAETVRSLTATEESDLYLMNTPHLLQTLALVARGGPFVVPENASPVPLASEKARLHACIAIMNLSCGKANKVEIASCPEVLDSMKHVMLNSTDEARLKATTCIKNLSNADANDAALLGTRGLVEALAHVAAETCSLDSGASSCTTYACIALMNLSIAKDNKHHVYRTPGTMDALMTVLKCTSGQTGSTEARIKACSALSNLAIGYDNKIPMFHYPGFVETILEVINTDDGETRTKACSILWSFAAEMRNQVPVVQRGDILPVLVRVAGEVEQSEARFKCVAALTLLAESLENVTPLLMAGSLNPLMEMLHEAGPDPTLWKGQTASWCVGFLMNIAQSDDAVPILRDAGVVELLGPLLTLDHYQSLKAAMAVTFCCRYNAGDECYDLLRKTENVIPKITGLLHNTLAGRGGNGYKYGVFTLRSSVGCISALASGPEFMKERIATGPVFESLLRVLTDFCVDGGTPGCIVGGGRDDTLSATLAMRALHSLTAHLIPVIGSNGLPFGSSMEERLLIALESFETCRQSEIKDETRALATDAKVRIEGGRRVPQNSCNLIREHDGEIDAGDVAFLASNCCGFDTLPCMGEDFFRALTLPTRKPEALPSSATVVSSSSVVEDEMMDETTAPVRTFLLTDTRTGRRFAVPCEQSGGRSFNDTRQWCFRRGRFCVDGEAPDMNYVWTSELQAVYEAALAGQKNS
ncbi:hypothetical protein MPSEU_000810200 [Mayamaea pseudoterrestris]|nr:hypothetical protein MPSEU_000810200 [Mayamaea pseudoterrestris]